MSEISTAIENIREAADRCGMQALAAEAGVPYTTVHSFASRGWTNKNVEIIGKLSEAAKRLAKRKAAAKTKAA